VVVQALTLFDPVAGVCSPDAEEAAVEVQAPAPPAT